VPVCLCSTTVVCPVALDLAGVVTSDALLLLLSPLADDLPSLLLASSLADVLLLRVSWLLSSTDALLYGVSSSRTDAWSSVDPWRMLCRHWFFGPF
jgi:hypothetical protein